MKKILVITPFFHPHVGGSEKYMERLYLFIKGKNPSVRVDILTYNTNKSSNKEKYKGLTIYRIPCWTILPDQFVLPKPTPLFDFLKSHKDYNLIHCSTRFFDSSWWGVIFAKMIGKKVVLTDHCAYHPVSTNPIISLIAKLIDLSIVQIFIRLYDQIYVESKTTQNFLKMTFNVQSKVAYPGVSIQDPKKRHKGKIKIIFVGRLIESKGVKILFDIAKQISKADFVFAGPGKLRERSKNIKFLGPINEKEVQKLLRESDIFAYPSLHSEGIPISILEAGGSGLAVISTDRGGIKEVIMDGKTGILVENLSDFKSSLEKLIDSKELRERLGRNLQKEVEKKFSWEKTSRLIFSMLRESEA